MASKDPAEYFEHRLEAHRLIQHGKGALAQRLGQPARTFARNWLRRSDDYGRGRHIKTAKQLQNSRTGLGHGRR